MLDSEDENYVDREDLMEGSTSGENASELSVVCSKWFCDTVFLLV